MRPYARVILDCIAARILASQNTLRGAGAMVHVHISNADPATLYDVHMEPHEVEAALDDLWGNGLIECEDNDSGAPSQEEAVWPTAKGWAQIVGPR